MKIQIKLYKIKIRMFIKIMKVQVQILNFQMNLMMYIKMKIKNNLYLNKIN